VAQVYWGGGAKKENPKNGPVSRQVGWEIGLLPWGIVGKKPEKKLTSCLSLQGLQGDSSSKGISIAEGLGSSF